MTPQRKRFIEEMSEAQRDVEIINAIEVGAGGGGANAATAQPRQGTTPTANGWVQLANVAGNSVIIENYTGKKLEVRRGASGTIFLPILDGMGREVDIVANANELYVRNITDTLGVTFLYTVVGEV